ncbi:hypothetical protein D3C78_970470 [compost metagenome]
MEVVAPVSMGFSGKRAYDVTLRVAGSDVRDAQGELALPGHVEQGCKQLFDVQHADHEAGHLLGGCAVAEVVHRDVHQRSMPVGACQVDQVRCYGLAVASGEAHGLSAWLLEGMVEPEHHAVIGQRLAE